MNKRSLVCTHLTALQCIELSKTTRPPAKDEKGKGKRRETQHDYNEASVHDSALRVQLQLAYEDFKVSEIYPVWVEYT